MRTHVQQIICSLAVLCVAACTDRSGFGGDTQQTLAGVEACNGRPPSAYAVIDSAGPAIVDANGTQWLLTADAKISVNGVVDPITKRVTRLALVGGILWQENADNLWWSKTAPADNWSPQDGTPTSPLSQTTGALVVTADGAIVDASGTQWTLTAGAQIAVNGTVDPITRRVLELVYIDGVVWQKNADNLWWSKTSPSDGWIPIDGNPSSPLSSESPDKTVITTAGLPIVDACGNTWVITTDAKIAVNGVVDPITKQVILIAYLGGVVWQENASHEWYAWTGSSWSDRGTTDPTAMTVSSGRFSVSGGKIIGPDGQPFVGYGFNILDDTLPTASLADIQGLFPKVNLIRLAIGGDCGGLYCAQPLPTLESWVNSVTAQGIVVMMESHYGGQPSASSINLNDEYNFYYQLASDLKDNPYVWFMSGNELLEPGVSAEHQNVYSAVRDAGNSTIIVFTVPGGNPVNPDDASAYRTMTNIAWDQHWYNHMTGGDTNQSNVDNDLTNIVSSLQAFTSSVDGTIPVITGETGFIDYAGGCGGPNGGGTLGDSFSCGTGQIILASFHAASSGVTSGTTVWLWHYTCCAEQTDLVDASTGTSLYNPYGAWVQGYIDQYSDGPL